MSKYKAFAEAKQLPPIPSTIRPLPNDVTPKAVVVAGVSFIGDEGYICPTVTILGANPDSGEIFGWSICFGHPFYKPDDEPYSFRIYENEGATTARGTEWPNGIVYFQAEVDNALALPEADLGKIDEVIAYVLPYISDEGPPPATGKSFDELIAEIPTSPAELQEVLVLKEAVSLVLDRACLELVGEGVWDRQRLLMKLNEKFHRAGCSVAWKSNPSDTDYNPDLGVIERMVAGNLVRVCIGLSKDRFDGPCAIVQIVARS